MKFRVQMKDPDTLSDAIDEAVRDSLKAIDDLDDEEREAAFEARRDKVSAIADKWFDCGEYLTVEIDTDAKTCVVVERRNR